MSGDAAGVGKHVLASANFFLGATNFVVIALPDRYVVGQTINPPEVAGSHPARGAAWVLDGRCSHYLRDAERGPSLELLVLTWRGLKPPPRWAESTVALRVDQHEAQLLIDEIRVGFPRRRPMVRLRAWWPCERTERTLQLEILGPDGTDLGPIAATLSLSECH